jgi:AcrR family transcriptional regulator
MSQPPSPSPGDPRVERTRHNLRVALLELADEHGYRAVTVGDIAARASVNRATFYRHYEDKEDLAADVFIRANVEAGRVAPILEGQRVVDVEARVDSETLVFEHIATNRGLYKPLLGYPRNQRFVLRVREMASAQLRERIAAARERTDIAMPTPGELRMPEELVLVFAVETFLGVVAWWLERGLAHSPRQMATWFIDFLFVGYFGVFGLDDVLVRPGDPPAPGA